MRRRAEGRSSDSRPRSRFADALYALASGAFAIGALMLAFTAVVGAGAFGMNLALAATAIAGGVVVLVVAVAIDVAGFRGSREGRKLPLWSALGCLAALALILALGAARNQLAEWRADRTVAAVKARALQCARREAASLPVEPYQSDRDPRPRYRRAVERCITEGGRFRDWPDGPQATCWSGACSIDLRYLDTYPEFDSRIVDLEPLMDEALKEVGAGGYNAGRS